MKSAQEYRWSITLPTVIYAKESAISVDTAKQREARREQTETERDETRRQHQGP